MRTAYLTSRRCAAARARKRGELVTYFAFDLLFHNGRDLRSLPLLERKERLNRLLPTDHPRLRYVDFIETEGEFMFEHAARIGLEGVVGKKADSPYLGYRSRYWLKSKPAHFHDGWKRPLRRKADAAH
jgi:bifunctional non-homologous end joining protein LigD